MLSSNLGTRENSAVATPKREAARLLAIELVGPSRTKASSVQYLVLFSTRVSHPDIRWFRLQTSGSACGVIASVLGLGDSCLITVNEVRGKGSMGLMPDTDCFEEGADLVNSPIYMIDHVTPSVAGLTVPVSGYYPVGQHLDVGVSYDVPITVRGGKPSLTMAFPCGRSVQAKLVEVVGTQLTFRHTVSDGDIQLNEVVWGREIQLNGATMHDEAGNSADTTLRGRHVVSQVLVGYADALAMQPDPLVFDLAMDKLAVYA
jgi:hypothetical protein